MATSQVLLSYDAAATAFAITLDSLASASSRQSTRVTQSSPGATFIEISGRFRTGTTPGSGKFVSLYLIKQDINGLADDGAGNTDAAITILNAPLLAAIAVSSGSNTETQFGPIVVPNPGLAFILAVNNGCTAALSATGTTSNLVYYRYFRLQAQSA